MPILLLGCCLRNLTPCGWPRSKRQSSTSGKVISFRNLRARATEPEAGLGAISLSIESPSTTAFGGGPPPRDKLGEDIRATAPHRKSSHSLLGEVAVRRTDGGVKTINHSTCASFQAAGHFRQKIRLKSHQCTERQQLYPLNPKIWTPATVLPIKGQAQAE
jgi:hypothetical protein